MSVVVYLDDPETPWSLIAKAQRIFGFKNIITNWQPGTPLPGESLVIVDRPVDVAQPLHKFLGAARRVEYEHALAKKKESNPDCG